MHSTTYLTTHSTMHSVTHPTTHSTTHSTTDPSQIAARSVSFVLSSFTFFFRVSLFYTCFFFCVILLRDNTRGMPRITWIMRRQRNGCMTPLRCSMLRSESYSAAANHRSHPCSHHREVFELQWLLFCSSKAQTPNPISIGWPVVRLHGTLDLFLLFLFLLGSFSHANDFGDRRL